MTRTPQRYLKGTPWLPSALRRISRPSKTLSDEAQSAIRCLALASMLEPLLCLKVLFAEVKV